METFKTSIISFFAGLSGLTAYALIFGVLLACGLGVPIPEDVTLIAAGYLVSLGKISLFGALIVGFFGVLAGDCFLFFIGRKFGRRALEWPVFRRIFKPHRVKIAEEKIQKNAKMICFTARFAPGLRAPTYMLSGILGVPTKVFLFQDGLAALLSVPLWVVLAYLMGDKIDLALKYAEKIQVYIIIAVVLVIIYLVIKNVNFKRKAKSQDT